MGQSLLRPPDRQRPFGYDAHESLYVTFRSLVLIGIMSFAALSATTKIVTYATGGEVPELVFGYIQLYVALMVSVCLALAAWHHHNWRRSGRRSEILRTESRAAVVDGAISAGAGGALLAVPLLRGTPLGLLVPIADSLTVLVLTVWIIRQPVLMFLGALREVAGGSAESAVVQKVREQTRRMLDERPFALLEVSVTKLGRSFFVASYLQPEGPVTASELDALREDLQQSYIELLGTAKSEVIVTGKPPYS